MALTKLTPSPLSYAFQDREGRIDSGAVRALVKSGFSPDTLSPPEVSKAFNTKDKSLVNFLLERGMLKPENGGELPGN
jgi:hypothetical protein